jgi:Raf kinase inhibitor-like YbhB/YbcL family protein
MKKTIRVFTVFAAAAMLLSGCAWFRSAAPATAATPGVFTLTAPGFADNALLEQRYAGNLASNPNCVGQNVSPPLAWTNVPAGTKSFAMLTYDQDGRSGLGVAHWVAYGIPLHVRSFAENDISRPNASYVGGKNTLNLPIYMGPCPPANTGNHHYVYTVIATDLEADALPPDLTMQELLTRLNGRAKASSSFVLRYGRTAP